MTLRSAAWTRTPWRPTVLGNFRIAFGSTPTQSGRADLLTMRGRCIGIRCAQIGEVALMSDAGGRPSGTVLGTMGFYLLEGVPGIARECGTLSPRPNLTAGTKYWAVMSAPEEVARTDWMNTPAQVLESVDGGAWTTAFNTKTPALRIDSGADACLPVAVPNPVSGTSISEM